MRQYLTISILFLASVVSALSAPAFVKSSTGNWFPTTGSNGSVTITPAATGNLIIVSAFAFTGATTISVSDSAGNTWNTVAGPTNGVFGNNTFQAWYAFANNTTADTITIHFADNSNYSLEIIAEEFSGVAALDKHTSTAVQGNTNPITIGPLSPASNGELLWAVGNSGAITGSGAGYTTATNFDITHSEYQVLGSSTGAGGSFSATFPTDSSGSNSDLVFATFTATATGTPAATLSPTSLTFGNTSVGSSSATQTITLTNSGTASLSTPTVSITGTNAGDFSQTNTCSGAVAASGTCTITVSFSPATTTGTRTAVLSISDNAPSSPQTASLTGTAVAGPQTAVYQNNSVLSEGPRNYFGNDTGSGNSYLCANGTGPAIKTYQKGNFYSFTATHANTGAATFNLNSIGSLTIKKQQNLADLASGDIAANAIITLQYDGTYMELVGQLGNASSGGSGLTTLSPSPAGTYGSSTTTPILTVDSFGRVTTASTATTTGAAGSYVGPDKNAISDFGCAGNGTTDDTTCLQNAINSVMTNNGNLYLPPGKYKTTATLTIAGAITIHGDMGTVCSDTAPWCGSQIFYTGTGTAIQCNGFTTRIYFRDLTISSSGGQGTAAVGVFLNQIEESGFERVNIGDYGGSGNEKKGFTAAIKTNHLAITFIEECNFQDDFYVLDVEGGFYAEVTIERCNIYRVTALVRADGGSSALNILNNWLEGVIYVIYADSANARLQGATIIGNHMNTDPGSTAACSGLPCSSAKMIEVTTGGGSMTSFFIAGNNINLAGASSFIDTAVTADHFAMMGNLLTGAPSVVFSGAGTVTVGTLANNMPSTLGTNATRLTQ
jgi:hypothetical protein